MNWASWSDFLAMGGYAFYVWGSYAVTAVLMIVEVIFVMRRRRDVLVRLARTVSAEQNEGNSDESA